MQRFTLYGSPHSLPTYKVALMLRLCGEPFSFRYVSFQKGMHKAPEFGIVREGMLADMVIVDQNPLQNFKVLYANGTIRLNDKTGKVERVGGIKWTIKDGIAYDAKKLAADVQAMVEKQKQAPKKQTTAQ